VLTGFGEECGGPLVAHRQVDGIAFTGSTPVGRRIGAVAGGAMRRVQLELGGKNPLVILADMDPDVAAEVAVAGAFSHAGQICMAPSRLIVERPLMGAFLEAMVVRCRALHLGDLRDPQTAYGPLIQRAALAKVQRHVAGALAAGARLLCGGEVCSGLTYAPTLLFEPPRDSAAWCEETFGPVVSVVAAEHLADAVEQANDSEYGLSAGVLTNDLKRGLRAARSIRAGAVHLGMHSFQTNTLAPVGGVGASGTGRSGGKYSTDAFTELKWVSAELSGQ
jgi:aldehyde dehydrogenase (NAD+)